MSKKTMIAAMVSEEMKRRIEVSAKAMGLSVSHYIRSLLDRHVEVTVESKEDHPLPEDQVFTAPPEKQTPAPVKKKAPTRKEREKGLQELADLGQKIDKAPAKPQLKRIPKCERCTYKVNKNGNYRTRIRCSPPLFRTPPPTEHH